MMKPPFRSTFLGSIALLLMAEAVAHSADTFSKETMLRDTAENVLQPAYADLDLKCRELADAVEHFVKSPETNAFERARTAWRGAARSAACLRSWQKGPVADRDAVAVFYYWQTLPARMNAVLESAQPIDQKRVDELGSTAKGLFAVQYLLFDPAASAAPMSQFLGGEGARRRDFVLALARDVQAKATQVAADWKATGAETATAQFAKAGQEGVNTLVNQLIPCVELITERQLRFVLSLPHPISRQLDRIERGRSGTSLEGTLAALEGAHRLYRGGDGLGLDDAVKRINPSLEKRVDEHFEAAIGAVRALAMPLETAATQNRAGLQAACDKTHALELLLKVDVASALGVTLTFTATDGD